jgi:hypothetical protein
VAPISQRVSLQRKTMLRRVQTALDLWR